LATAYEADGQKARAINEYNRAILLDPYEESYYFQLSQLLIDQENFATARQVLEAARKIFDKSPEIELALGTAYYGLKKYDEAGFWESHYQLGLLLEKRQMLMPALEELKKSAALAPRNPAPHQQMARVYDLMGRPADAKIARAAAEKAAAGDKPRPAAAAPHRKK